MVSMAQSTHDRLAHAGDMSQDPALWQRGLEAAMASPVLDANDPVTPR